MVISFVRRSRPQQCLQQWRKRTRSIRFRPSTSHWRLLHSARSMNLPAAATVSPEILGETLETKPKSHCLTPEQRRFLDGAVRLQNPCLDMQWKLTLRQLRVNQAGELAAVLIYDAQTPPIVRSHPHLKELMRHMYDQEAGHFRTFNQILSENRVRPTIMYPVWRVAATALGWGTALMGREAAMACTEAVETEIGQHYNDQVRVLLDWAKEAEIKGEGLGPELTELVTTLRRIRDEELEHLDHAVQNDAKEAQPYELLTNIIRTGCRYAIRISERI